MPSVQPAGAAAARRPQIYPKAPRLRTRLGGRRMALARGRNRAGEYACDPAVRMFDTCHHRRAVPRMRCITARSMPFVPAYGSEVAPFWGMLLSGLC